MQLIPNELQHSLHAALYENESFITYAELWRRVEWLADRLPKQRSLAFCFCRTDSGTVVNYLACLRADHPVLLLDAHLQQETRQALINRYEPEILMASANLPDLANADAGYSPEATTEPSSILWRANKVVSTNLYAGLNLLLSTSGSTGNPKLVRLSGTNVVANADAIRQALCIQPSDRAMCSLPFQYSYGLSVLNSHLRAGASLALTLEGILSSSFWNVCRKKACTGMAGVPYTYEVLRRLKLDELDVPNLKTLTQAGGKLATPLIEHFAKISQQRGGRFFVMYGQTEATARMTILPFEALGGKCGSVGLPIGGGKIEIEPVGPASASAVNQQGQIIYYGPNVMLGYAESRADLSRGDDLQGRLCTGDLGCVDGDGYLSVASRMQREAKISGYRINLDDVEALLKNYGPAAAISRKDKISIFCEWGDAKIHASALQMLARQLHFSLGAFEIRQLPALPLSSNGKIDYKMLASMR